MIKKLLVVATMVFSAVAVMAAPAYATPQDPQYFCHRTSSVTNPYSKVPLSETYSEVDGQGQNDHSQHTGLVFDPQVHNNQNKTWGDIIPPIDGVTNGLNWPAGYQIWKNECEIPAEEGSVIVFEVVCAEVREETVVQVTFRNFGTSEGSAWLNGEEVVVEGGATVIRYIELDTEVKIEINEKIVYQDTPECEEPEEGEVLAEEDTPEGAVDAGMGNVALLGLIASGAVVASGVALARKQTN